jgi:hypothetical protein
MRITRRVAVGTISILALVAMLAVTGQAGASQLPPGLAISIGSEAQLVNGVYLQVPVQVTCPVLVAPFTTIADDSIGVAVYQKTSGKTVAYGNGGILYYPGYGTAPLTCDGTAHSYTVQVFPAPLTDGGPVLPFHGGRAVAGGGVNVDLVDPSTGAYDCCNFATVPSEQSLKIQG